MTDNNYQLKGVGKSEKWLDYVLLAFCILLIFLTVYPFLNVLAISLNDPMDTMRNINFIIPRKFTLSNYIYIFKENNLGSAFVMSVLRTVVGTGIGVICTAMLAYVLSRKDFYFNKLFTILFIITMYVSGGMIPEYLLLTRTLHMSNKFMVYIIPGLIWVYNVILMRSFIEGLPMALQEAAKIDGAGVLQVFTRIMIPLGKPIFAVVAVYTIVGVWNSWFGAMLYLPHTEWQPLQLYLRRLLIEASQSVKEVMDAATAREVAERQLSNAQLKYAMIIFTTLPVLCTYPFFQKYFVKGMVLGSLKE